MRLPAACARAFVAVWERHGRTLVPRQRQALRGVSREAAIADDGEVFTGEFDRELVSHAAPETDAAAESRTARASN